MNVITDLHLEAPDFPTYGLAPITMSRLGRVVMLAGPNGGGKSRVLRSVIEGHRRAREARNELKGPVRYDESHHEALQRRGAALRASVDRQEEPVMLSYSLKPDIYRVDVMTPQQFGRNMSELHAGYRYDHVQRNVEVYLTSLAWGMFHSEHPRTRALPEIKQTNEERDRFDSVCKALLDTEIGFELNDRREPRATLFGRRFDPDELSSGQMVLLFWASVLSRRPGPLRTNIICLDEPELYLHPAVATHAVRTLLDDVLGPDGQLWIATHSLPLIADICSTNGLDCLFAVQNGRVSHAGSSIAAVTESLLGGEKARERVTTFLGSSDEVAFASFVAECLEPATVASHFGGDRQASVVVNTLSEAGRELRLLDYCAGRGRIAAALAATSSPRSSLHYTTYHDLKYSSAAEVNECARNLERLAAYVGSVHMLFDGEVPAVPGVPASEWREGRRESLRADLVLLANTLHEVPPVGWGRFLRRIRELARPDGTLLVIEDQEPRIGELPHASGFLLLNSYELETLFRSKTKLISASSDRRLTMYEVPCDLIDEVTNNSIHDTIDLVIERAKERISNLRQQSADRASGRLHGLYSMMLANAHLAKDELPPRS